ncbi:MAG TPA: nucleotidyltransferase family protein [Tepidisphaeraceae bacterium]|nr:nucleotidyltransferase family protein [Tepidisphaeraceae bacterium]
MSRLSDICAIILAGGFGTRLRSVVADRPKVLATVCGRPFLVHLLDQLRQAGVRRAILCTGYMSEQIEAAFGDAYGPIELTYSQENQPLGTGGAIAAATDLGDSHTLLAINGDSFCAADLNQFAADHFNRDARASILLTHVNDASRFGRVTIAPNGRITSFDEKSDSVGPGLINAGIYLIERRLLEVVPRRHAVSIEREIFPLWIGHGLFGHVTLAPFIDIGTPESYAMAQNFFGREAA